jgi:hypothetical protein
MTDLSPDVQALLDESYKSDLTEEESEELLLLCGHGIGKKLSPSAQAVLDAHDNAPYENFAAADRLAVAAALRAAADQLVPAKFYNVNGGDRTVWETKRKVRDDLLVIAAELENQ